MILTLVLVGSANEKAPRGCEGLRVDEASTR